MLRDVGKGTGLWLLISFATLQEDATHTSLCVIRLH